jgi:hypothetical protein
MESRRRLPFYAQRPQKLLQFEYEIMRNENVMLRLEIRTVQMMRAACGKRAQASDRIIAPNGAMRRG